MLLVRSIRLPIFACFMALATHAEAQCPAGYALDSQGKCTMCAAGYERNPKTGACEKPLTCPTGQVSVLGRCFPACPDGYTHDSQGKCTLCASGYQKDPKTQACVRTGASPPTLTAARSATPP